MFRQVGNFIVESEGKHKLVLDDSVIWPNDSSAPSSNVLKCRSCDEHCYNGKSKVDRAKKLGSNTWNTRDCLSLTSRRDLKIRGALQLQTKMGKLGSNISHTRCRVLPYFQSTKKRVGPPCCISQKLYTSPEVVGINFNGSWWTTDTGWGDKLIT